MNKVTSIAVPWQIWQKISIETKKKTLVFFHENAYCAAAQKTSYFDKLKHFRKNFSTPTWRAKTFFHLNNDLDVITPMWSWTGWKAVAYDMIICTYECTSPRSLTFNLSCQSLFLTSSLLNVLSVQFQRVRLTCQKFLIKMDLLLKFTSTLPSCSNRYAWRHS